jgi:hypothetical protein
MKNLKILPFPICAKNKDFLHEADIPVATA